MSGWPDVLYHRQQIMKAFVNARTHAIHAGDRATLHFIDGAILRQRERVRYARKMADKVELSFTPKNARFASIDNRPDNRGSTGTDNAR